MTAEERAEAIDKALSAREQVDGIKETYPLVIRGCRQLLSVVSLRITVPLLNHVSHRIRAQLTEDPDYALVRAEPFGEAAQNTLARLVRERHREFAELKASLRVDNQREAGVITRDGVLVNANTRLVALRELAAPDRQQIKVAVLPADISNSAPDLLEIETGLQVQRELKDPYSLVNELLLIEDLAVGEADVGRSHAQIAALMRYEGATSESSKDRKQAERQVKENLDLLRMIRHLASLPRSHQLPLTIFDAGGTARERRQPLIEVCRRYDEYLQRDGLPFAEQFAREWLFAFLAGAGAVHKARTIAPGWIDEFVMDELREDPRFSDRVDVLVAAAENHPPHELPVADGLHLLDDSQPLESGATLVNELLDLLATARTSDDDVPVPGGEPVEASDLRSVMTSAALAAIKTKERTEKDEKAVSAPSELIRAARRNVRLAGEAFDFARQAPEFQRSRFELDLKRLRKDVDVLEKRACRELRGNGDQ